MFAQNMLFFTLSGKTSVKILGILHTSYEKKTTSFQVFLGVNVYRT